MTGASPAVRAVAWVPAVLWAMAIFVLSGQPVPPQPPGVGGIPFIDKAQHMVEYGILAILVLIALRRSHRAPGWAPAALDPVLAAIIAAAYGATDEVHQLFVPQRAADLGDLAFDALGAFVFALGLAPYIPPRAEPSDERTQRLQLPQGTVAYIEEGEGPAVVHIHGWRGSKRYFEGAPARAPGYRHIALDLLGFADSAKPVRFGYAPADHARVVRDAMRALRVEHATVVGHSMGGAVALALQRLDPARVDALVLVEPALHLGVPAPFPVTLDQARSAGLAVSRLARGDALAMARAIVARPEALDNRFLADAMNSPVHAALPSLAKLARDSGALVDPPPAVPTLLVFGDPAFGVRAAYAKELGARFPKARLVHVGGTNHCPMIEAPDEFWGIVERFLNETRSGGAP